MRSGVTFVEDYADAQADVRMLDEWIGWRPQHVDDIPRGLYAFLRTLRSGSAHGGPFVYRSAETDALGWVCERAGGRRMADLISTLVWGPMGAESDAEIICDGNGTSVHNGGLCATARDLARFGQLLLDDGRMAFLDFGLFKRMDAADLELELRCQRAVVEDDAERLHRLLAESGFLPQPDRVKAETLMSYVRDSIWWYTTDESYELTPEIATGVLIESSDPRSSHFREMRHQDMRPEHLFGRRTEMLTLAVLAQLHARANWHRIAREWMYGDAPVTELGRAEAAFYGRA